MTLWSRSGGWPVSTLRGLSRTASNSGRYVERGQGCGSRGARRGGETLMRRRVSVLLDPLQTPQEARRPMYRPTNRETLGDGRGREASVTPPRPPRVGPPAATSAASSQDPRRARVTPTRNRGDSMRGETLKARRGVFGSPPFGGPSFIPTQAAARRGGDPSAEGSPPPTGLLPRTPRGPGMGWPSVAPTHGQHTLRIVLCLAWAEDGADHRHRVPGNARDLLVRPAGLCAITIAFANGSRAVANAALERSSSWRCWSSIAAV